MNEETAKARFMVLQAARISGVLLAMFGVAIIAGKIPLPEIAGIVFVVIGAIDVLFVPVILARRWKSGQR